MKPKQEEKLRKIPIGFQAQHNNIQSDFSK